jgi:hypothetical protein
MPFTPVRDGGGGGGGGIDSRVGGGSGSVEGTAEGAEEGGGAGAGLSPSMWLGKKRGRVSGDNAAAESNKEARRAKSGADVEGNLICRCNFGCDQQILCLCPEQSCSPRFQTYYICLETLFTAIARKAPIKILF